MSKSKKQIVVNINPSTPYKYIYSNTINLRYNELNTMSKLKCHTKFVKSSL
jgi:hypothetical protein